MRPLLQKIAEMTTKLEPEASAAFSTPADFRPLMIFKLRFDGKLAQGIHRPIGIGMRLAHAAIADHADAHFWQ